MKEHAEHSEDPASPEEQLAMFVFITDSEAIRGYYSEDEIQAICEGHIMYGYLMSDASSVNVLMGIGQNVLFSFTAASGSMRFASNGTQVVKYSDTDLLEPPIDFRFPEREALIDAGATELPEDFKTPLTPEERKERNRKLVQQLDLNERAFLLGENTLDDLSPHPWPPTRTEYEAVKLTAFFPHSVHNYLIPHDMVHQA
ncbi:MAG: hypothetical protein JWL89_392 [Candidatus Saccharibacteria bacterium]|nr:hypothetical protein [Candidatus Saccharibacteria bacterium]